MVNELGVNWSYILKIINNFSNHFDDDWRKRKRKIDTQFLIIFIMRIIFSRANLGYQGIIEEIWDNFDKSGITPPQAKPFYASSVCEARQKFLPEIIQEINTNLINEFFELNENNFRWHGKRIFAIDGSNIFLPRELIKEGYVQDKATGYVPYGKLSCLFHVGTGIVPHVILDQNGDERELAKQHLEYLLPEDVIVFDRGYFSYGLSLSILNFGNHFVFRFSENQATKEMINFIKSEKAEDIVKIKPTDSFLRKGNKKHLFLKNSYIITRLIRYSINNKSYYLATSLCDNQIPAQDIADLYHKRWGIEEHYKIEKSLINIQNFHAKSEQGVLQEIYCATLLTNIARIMGSEVNEYKAKQDEELKKKDQISSYVQKIMVYMTKKASKKIQGKKKKKCV